MRWLEVLGWGNKEVDDLRIAGHSYIQQGAYKIALIFFEGITALTPPIAYDLQTIGALHLQLNDPLHALEALDHALKLEPGHLPTQLNRAKALLMLGRKSQSLAQAVALQQANHPEIAAQAAALILALAR